MMTEIPEKSWHAFCQQLKDHYRGVVSIRWTQPGGVVQIVAENTPLQNLMFQKRLNECSDLMMVEAGEPGAHPLQHEIVDPFCILLKQNAESRRYNELEILAETGKTEIDFTPGIDPRLVENLAE